MPIVRDTKKSLGNNVEGFQVRGVRGVSQGLFADRSNMIEWKKHTKCFHLLHRLVRDTTTTTIVIEK